jgi:L-threonylcarbamoyladenylate synthase
MVEPVRADTVVTDTVVTDTVVTGDVEAGAEALRRGQLVAFPTETVYGLGADASSGGAVRRIFVAKGRPAGHPLIVHLAAAEQVGAWSRLDGDTAARVEALAGAFWPGPLTMIVPRGDRVAPETVGGRESVGLRVPAHPVARELLRRFGGGVAAPSANRFGRVSPTTAAHVADDLRGVIDVIVDGGPTAVGIESTIVELVGPRPLLLRPGAVTGQELAEVLGEPVGGPDGGPARAPGMLRSHYAPAAEVSLIEADAVASEAGLAGAVVSGSAPTVAVIAPVGVEPVPGVVWRVLPAEAGGFAAGLYATLRSVDRVPGVSRILVVPPVGGAMIDAVIDRLTRASAPRS